MAMPSAITSGCHPIFTSRLRSETLRPSAALARCSTIGRNQFQSQITTATMIAPIKTTGMAISSRRLVVMLFGIAGRSNSVLPGLRPISRNHGTCRKQVTFPPYSNRHCAEVSDGSRNAKQIEQPHAVPPCRLYECWGIAFSAAAGRFEFLREP